jgi:hypothetical protein
MIDPTVAEALARLCSDSATPLRTPQGVVFEFGVSTVADELASGTAPRDLVAPGMLLIGEVCDERFGTWRIELRVVRADYATPELSAVTVRATAVRPDDSRRGDERVPAGGITWLVAVDCTEVEGGSRVEGSLQDLSRTGVSFVTTWPLLPGDRLVFHGRFFTDEISADVVVASVRPSPRPGRRLAGCSFSELPELDQHRIEKILASSTDRQPATPVDVAPLRAIAGGQLDASEDDGANWRRLFRRT